MWMPSIIQIIFIWTAHPMTICRAMRRLCDMWTANWEGYSMVGKKGGAALSLFAARTTEPVTVKTAANSTASIIRQ